MNLKEDRLAKVDKEQGFTLIELLVTVAITGILASIAMSSFATYKGRAYDGQALSDLKNGITAEEAYYSDNNTYVDCAAPAACEASLPGFVASKGGDGMTSFSFTSAGQTYTGEASHQGGLSDFSYDSASGDLTQADK